MFKHRLKLQLRRLVARLCHLTGLRALFRRGRPGVPVLMFHNVGHGEDIAYLPGHMKTGTARVHRLLRLLKRAGYRTITVRDMVAAFERGETPDDAVVLTFDDGYRDNHDVLLPILKEHGATATVFVQTGPMKGRLNWLHHYFWMLHREGPHALGARMAEGVSRRNLAQDLRALPAGDVAGEYELKRLLKYEIGAEERDRLLAEIFTAAGGDERALAAAVYLGPDDCRALDAAGVELGAHTVNHLILSSLDEKRQRQEIEGSLRDLQSWVGGDVPSFAYPYGRAWDYDDETRRILGELGFRSAITAMPGHNDPSTPRLELRRFAVNDDSDLAEVMCAVDGVFAWFARRGISLGV